MGHNFQYYDGLQPKIRAGIINEHECMYLNPIPTRALCVERVFLNPGNQDSRCNIDINI